jgi:LemA protein
MKSIVKILAIVLLIPLLSGCGYNRMVELDESVTRQWAQVENAYQRRADLIPNLVETVKGYADFERETLTEVIEARSRATSINVDPANLTPEAIQQFQAAQDQLSGALSRLMVVVERYPELKANQNFWSCRPNWKVQKTGYRSNA